MFSKRLSDQNARRDQAVEVLSQWQRQLDQTLTEQREQLRRSTELLSEKTATGSTVILNELQSGRIESAIRASIKPPVVGGGDNVVACEVDGLILGVPGEEWRMAAYYAFRGTMEPGPTRLFKEMVKPGMVVVDIGANIGIYTLETARLMAPTGRVYSFEPAPRVFGILKDNIQVNGFRELGIIHARQVAVSDRAGTAQFYIHSRNSGHSSLFPDEGADEKLMVQTITLDQALESIGQVDVVKIDAEGSEPL